MQRIYETEVPETYVYPMEVASLFATDADSKSYGPLDIRISGGLDSADFQVFQYVSAKKECREEQQQEKETLREAGRQTGIDKLI